MTIITNTKADTDDMLEGFRPADKAQGWDLVASGFWSDDIYHSGHIAYYITKTKNGVWVLDGVQGNTELHGISEEDVEEGRLNDDQLQAMWGVSLEEAQNQQYRRITAVIQGASHDMKPKEAAELMLAEIRKSKEFIIDE